MGGERLQRTVERQDAEFEMRKPERGLRGLTRIKGLSHPSTLRSGASPIADQGCAATEDGRPSMSWVVKFCGLRGHGVLERGLLLREAAAAGALPTVALRSAPVFPPVLIGARPRDLRLSE